MENQNYYLVGGIDETQTLNIFGIHNNTQDAFEQAQYFNTNDGCVRVFLTKERKPSKEIVEKIQQMAQKFLLQKEKK